VKNILNAKLSKVGKHISNIGLNNVQCLDAPSVSEGLISRGCRPTVMVAHTAFSNVILKIQEVVVAE
jgi:hypothetical protein